MIITGASSGLGLAAAKSLADSGQWHVIMVGFCSYTVPTRSVKQDFCSSAAVLLVCALDICS